MSILKYYYSYISIFNYMSILKYYYSYNYLLLYIFIHLVIYNIMMLLLVWCHIRCGRRGWCHMLVCILLKS